eukprot:s4761_g3.t1
MKAAWNTAKFRAPGAGDHTDSRANAALWREHADWDGSWHTEEVEETVTVLNEPQPAPRKLSRPFLDTSIAAEFSFTSLRVELVAFPGANAPSAHRSLCMFSRNQGSFSLRVTACGPAQQSPAEVCYFNRGLKNSEVVFVGMEGIQPA